MNIIRTNDDGSLTAKIGAGEHIAYVVECAKQLAAQHDTSVHFTFNNVPIAVAADTDLNLMLRAWQARPAGDVTQIGPHPDPDTAPLLTHGIDIVEI